MTMRESFHRCMSMRRNYARGSSDHAAITRTARKLIWLMRGVPVDRWTA